MKLIHTADWHLGRTLAQYSLIDDQRHFLDQFIRFCADAQADAVLIAGDLYNRALPGAPAVELLDETLSRLVLEHGIRVAAVAGNHDSPERLSFCHGLLRGAGLYIAGNAGDAAERVDLGGNVVCWLLPFCTPAQARQATGDGAISTANDAFAAILRRTLPLLDPSRFNILVTHGFFSRLGGRGEQDPVFSASELSVGALDIADITEAAAAFDYIALGHLHAPQRAGFDHVRYAGSPLKYSLSERGQRKSVTVVETGGKGEIALSEQSFAPLRDVRLIEGDFDSLLSREGQPDAALADYVYANIVGDDAVLYAMQRLRGVYPNILGLSFLSMRDRAETVRAAEVAGRGIEDLFGEFYERVTGAPLTPRRAELVRGLAREAASGRPDETARGREPSREAARTETEVEA